MGWADAPIVGEAERQPSWMAAPEVAAQAIPAGQEPPLTEPGVTDPTAPVFRGLRDVWDAGAQMLAHGASAITPDNSALGRLANRERQNTDRVIQQGEQDYQRGQRQGETGVDWGRMLGNIIATGPLAPEAAATLPVKLAQGAGMGAASGALQPVTDGGDFLTEKAQQAGLGAAAGTAGAALGSAVGRVISPKASTNADVLALRASGVSPTPGQTAGGALARLEEGATSTPILGDAIRSGQRRAVEQFNVGALNNVLGEAGMTLPKGTKAGREAITKAGDLLSDRYEALVPKLTAKVDQQFADDLSNIMGMAQSMPSQRAEQLRRIVGTKLASKISPNGTISGESLKQAESELGRAVRGYRGSQDYDQRQLGDALQEVQTSLRSLLARSNPDHSEELNGLNKAYAGFLRVENAAGRLGSKEGVFSPAALNSAARSMDSTLRKRGFARGKALMQDYATAGENVLGSKVPDSGTPLRAATVGMIAGAGHYNPLLPIAASAGGLLYSRPLQGLLSGAIGARPAAAGALADITRKYAPVLGADAAPYLLGQR